VFDGTLPVYSSYSSHNSRKQNTRVYITGALTGLMNEQLYELFSEFRGCKKVSRQQK